MYLVGLIKKKLLSQVLEVIFSLVFLPQEKDPQSGIVLIQ